jgi:gas vesicle protein
VYTEIVEVLNLNQEVFMRGNSRVLVTGLVVGAAAGAGAGLLLAPQAGKQTRAFIGRKGGEVISKVRFKTGKDNSAQANQLSRISSG